MFRATALFAGTACSLLLLAAPASAHVTAHSADAVPGGHDAEISFRVPNEEDSLTTKKVVIALPADQPLAGVMPAPKPGWSVAVTTRKLATPIATDDGDLDTAVATLTWTATAGGTPAGQYDDFDIAVGQLPTTGSLTFKALQTYSNGSTVSWIEPTPPGGEEPEHPAPVLELVTAPAAGRSSATPTATASATATPMSVSTTSTSSGSSDGTAKALGGTALGVAVLAALLALAALLRDRAPRRG